MYHEVYDAGLGAWYDQLFPEATAEETVGFLDGALPAPGNAIEFGVGSGRVALPMLRRGWSVTGVDISPRMLGAFESKAREAGLDERVRTRCASMAEDTGLRGYDLAYCVLGGLACLPDPAVQAEAVAGMLRHVGAGGLLVVENYDRDFWARSLTTSWTGLGEMGLRDGVHTAALRARLPEADVLEMSYEIGDARGPVDAFRERVRLTPRDFVARCAREAGAEGVRVLAGWAGAEGAPSGSVVTVARRG